ncbi:MAG: galactokinase family protein [Candidatus Kryptoniota bacterium]
MNVIEDHSQNIDLSTKKIENSFSKNFGDSSGRLVIISLPGGINFIGELQDYNDGN